MAKKLTALLKVAVVGVGHLGKIHAAIYHRIPSVELVAVVDTDEQTATRVAQEFNCTPYNCASQLKNKVDAVSIVVPTSEHRKVAEKLLKMGMHILLEKPIAPTVKDAAAIVRLAKKNLVLQIGHVERFNAGVIKLAELATEPRFIEVHRLCKFVARGVDVDVIADLMIHDIDIVLSLVPARLKKISANGTSVLTRYVDIANARLEFENGVVANVTASRVSQRPFRRIRVFGNESYHGLNFNDQQLDCVFPAEEKDQNGFPKLIQKRIDVKQRPPLDAEIAHFVDCVLQDKQPQVSGEDGLIAVQVAQQVRKKILASAAKLRKIN